MFYQCPKCKKSWQYKIEKCPQCFLTLERIKSQKVKIISVSKVNISTILHPKAPYFVLLLEDERGNRWIQKSIKEYKIGQEFKIEPALDKNAVSVWRIKYDVLEGVEKVIELLGGLKVDSKTKVLILPTLVSPIHPYLAENTNPEFLESLIEYLLQKGIKMENIKVAGQSFNEIPIEASAQKSQLLNVCQNFKIPPLDLSKTKFIKKEMENFNFEVSEEVFNSDLIINLPILKVGKISAAENILKVLKKENYLGLRYFSSEGEILEKLNRVLPSYLTIADGQIVQKPDQFTTFLGLILASFSSLNLDRVFNEISMVKNLPEELKNVKVENVKIVGRQIEELKYEVEKF